MRFSILINAPSASLSRGSGTSVIPCARMISPSRSRVRFGSFSEREESFDPGGGEREHKTAARGPDVAIAMGDTAGRVNERAGAAGDSILATDELELAFENVICLVLALVDVQRRTGPGVDRVLRDHHLAAGLHAVTLRLIR